MNAIVQQQFGALSTRFANVKPEDDLSAGIQGGFGIMGYRGKTWATKYRGAETPLMRADGDGPRGSIEVVILKGSGHISKIWYEQGWVEGSNAAPDCYSTNGLTPDVGAAKKQHTACAACLKNAWGSRITPAGKQGKACQDSKRLAIVPLDNLENTALGGPMLLRVPAASLQDLAQYDQKMRQLGFPYYAIGTRISFDPAESYPKFLFGAIRPLSDAEADTVLKLREGPEVARILAESEIAPQQVPQAQQITQAFEQPPVQPTPAPTPAPAPQPAPAPAPAPVQAAPQPAPQASAGFAQPTAQVTVQAAPASSFEASLDAQLDKLLG